MPTEFHFLRPWWLASFVPLIVFLVLFARRRFAQRRWRAIIDPQLMPHVLIGSDYQTRRRVTAILALAGALMITALAGPAWQQLPQPVFRSQDALVIALDLSRSMDVADVKPSRLSRARFKINDILVRREEGQTALIAYAAEPYVISPLTDDTLTIIAQLPALTTDLMPSQGSRADRALEKAAELLNQSGVSDGRILLVTDGADARQTTPEVRRLKEKGIRVSVLGVGTDDGGPIPGRGGFVKRRDGSIIIAKFDAVDLKAIAEQGGGLFSRLSADESDIDRLLTGMTERPDETEDTGLEANIWREEGPWLLLPLLPLAALAFRRGVLAVWLLVFLLPIRPAEAFEWSDLWSRPDQRASRALEEGDSAGAAELFIDPAWKGIANYRAGQYEESLAALDGLDGIEPTYNRGNALAKLGRYDEAIAAYEEVLERDAKHRDARYNRDLLLEQMKQQQQQGENGEPDQSGESPQESQAGEQPASGEPSTDDLSDAQQGDEASQADTGERTDGADKNETQPEPASDPAAETAAQQAESENTPDNKAQDEQTAMANADERPLDEDEQATEQWLRKIPDDPGGLLRRKFYYQYQRQNSRQPEKEPW